MNITWALLMMALGGVGVQHTGHEADVSAALQSAANPPITAAGQSGTSGPNTAAGNPAQSPAPSAAPGAADSALHTDPQPDAPKVKGIYVTAYSAGGERMEQLLGLLDKTELNSMVIDIKDDAGYITYKTDNAELQEMGTPRNLSVISTS